MFWKIFLFEIQNRIRRPAVFLYFAAVLIFTIGSFATGSLPVAEKEHINSPYLIAFWCAAMTMMMMLISSSVMGVALYRDIEYNTKDYYLTYPITKAGYFWGRFLGSFACMLFIVSGILLGIYIGTKMGPAMGWRDAKEYGPNLLSYYLHPFFIIAIPNIFFTSALFFGLVAITRNVKVIYSGGLILFLGYFIAIFALNHTNDEKVINLADPFALNGVRFASGSAGATLQNNTLLPIRGNLLWNRILWPGIGLVVLIYTYLSFSFEKFFSGRRDKAAIDSVDAKIKRSFRTSSQTRFDGSYNWKTLLNLTKIELTNIFRDNYFWMIISCGMIFLGLVFWMGNRMYDVPYFPRTVMLIGIFNEVFPFFIFFIIVFYTGETLHRDRITRYALINDSLPPPNWVLNGSKLTALLCLGATMAFIPVFLGILVQTMKGFHHYNFSAYITNFFIVDLPMLLEMVLFSYLVHVVVNNKFVAHGIAITIWVLVFFLRVTGTFNYNLVLYSYTPWFGISDMDGMGHMMRPVVLFNIYWSVFGGLLIIVAALFYFRGVSSSFKERLQLAKERFDARTRNITIVLLVLFLAIGSYLYYNVSYLNNFLIKSEDEGRAIAYEKNLKKYQALPLPKISAVKMWADIYPDKQQEFVHAFVTIQNKTSEPIDKILFDGDQLSNYSMKMDGVPVSYSSPLLFKRAFFSVFRPKFDTAAFRLYQFKKPLAPGDSAVLEFNTSIVHKGFENGLYAANLLRNGTFFNGGLPGFGYDDDDEISSPYVRKHNGLPPREDEEIAPNDPEGIQTLKAGKAATLITTDLIISTSGDQTVVAPGNLVKQWKQNGRSYFQYVQNDPGSYPPEGIVSANLAVLRETVHIDKPVKVSIYYDPQHATNINRFLSAYRDGLSYFSSVYGNYPFTEMKLVETSHYSQRSTSMPTMNTYSENFGWNADFSDPNKFDFAYFNTVQLLSQQWWRFQVAPNNTVGSLVIPEGLAVYSALAMFENKYGAANIKNYVQDQLWFYLFIRTRLDDKEHPLLTANEWFEWGGKAGVALYGLKDLIGENSMNAALKEFRDYYAFRKDPPYAGASDLYRFLQKHTPDSLRYYLTDTWEKITLYDNKLTSAKSVATGNKDEYKVTINVDVSKSWIDDKKNDIPAKGMNDYIDIGVFGERTKNKDGRWVENPLQVKKYKLGMGSHTIEMVVKGKPVTAGIDPYARLIDRQPNDNVRGID